MKCLLVDMDDVLADTLEYTIKVYEQQMKTKINREKLIGNRLEDVVSKEHICFIKRITQQKGFFSSIPVKQNSIEVMHQLKTKYDIYVVSAALHFPNSLIEKYYWLNHNFEFLPNEKIIFCGEKRIISGEIMIDDNVFNLENFNGRRILFSAPHNLLDTRYERVNNWNEVKIIL